MISYMKQRLSIFNVGHDALVYDVSKSCTYGTYVQTIEAVKGGVQYGYLDDTRMVNFNVIILRVKNATDSVVSEVRDFCLGQIGKAYSYNFGSAGTDYNQSSWFCSELIYASYLSAGIDVWGNSFPSCTPREIYENSNTYEIADYNYIVDHAYLEVAVSGKSGNTWQITITNISSYTRVVAYNAKMCSKYGAKNWSGLSDVMFVLLEANSSVTVDITENVFATCIAVSYVASNYRFITYADQLSTKLTLTSYTAAILQ